MPDILFFTRQEEFAGWLEANSGASELWVGYYKKNADQTGLSWSESVDVALCYGWIDGIRKTIDAQSYKIRFTPRQPDSVWSAVNVQKVEALKQQGRMTPAGLQRFDSRSDARGYSAADRKVPFPAEYEGQIRADAAAWAYFCDLAPSYKRDSIWWVMSAKRKETRLKRLGILIASSAEGEKIPMLRKA